MKPDYARNMTLIGHTDQGGRPDGVQVMVNKGHAFVGHMFSKGFSVYQMICRTMRRFTFVAMNFDHAK